jgi:hypothetical protein
MTESMDAMKKGGKAKRKGGKKKASQSMKQSVKVNVNVGDSVLLHKGKAPLAKLVGVAKRLVSPGNLYGGGLPAPLRSSAYMSAPSVAMPLSRVEFIGSSDAFYNRNRNKSDDIPIEVNPSEIKPDIIPSKRLIENKKVVETPDTGLAIARMREMLNKAQADVEQALNKPFQGEQPRVGGANLHPSERAVASQPTTGFMNTKASLIGSSSGKEEAQSAWAEMSAFKPAHQSYEPAPSSLFESSKPSVSQPGREIVSPSRRRRPAEETQYHTPELLYGKPKQKREPPENPQSLRRGGSVF